MRKEYKKGFTLAELLIVIAIISVLVGIMFPIFGGSLEKSKEAVDAANIRSQYGEVASRALLEGKDINHDGSELPVIVLTQTKDSWQNKALKESLHSIFDKVVDSSDKNDAEPIANGSAWVEYDFANNEIILYYSNAMVSGTPEVDRTTVLVNSANNLIPFLNVGSDAYLEEFTFAGGWLAGRNPSLGKALVSGKGNDDIKNALKAQGNEEASLKAYIKVDRTKEMSAYDSLKSELVFKSGFDQLYKSYGAYAVYTQTKEDMSSIPKNGEIEVIQYIVVEGQNPKDKALPNNGYVIVGVRETTVQVTNSKVTNGYSTNVDDWTVVLSDSQILKK